MRNIRVTLLAFLFFSVVSGAGGLASNASGSSDINVSVVRECEVEQNTFRPPGNRSVAINGTEYNLNVIGVNETDAFEFGIYNTGNRNASVTVNLTVTNQSETWEPGEDLGNFINLSKQKVSLNESYEPFTLHTTYYIPAGETAVGNTYHLVMKLFRALYPTGHYTGRLEVNYTCPNIQESRNLSDHGNFMILSAEVINPSGSGDKEGGTKGDIPSDTPFPSLANQTGNLSTNTTAPRDANQTGNFTSNVTAPENVGEEGNATTNITLPQDVNRTGESSNQTVPQDVNQTGETSNQTLPAQANRTGARSNQSIEREANRTGEKGQEVPGNADKPGQTPEPDPKLIIDIEPLRDTYIANQSQFAPVSLNITNSGGSAITDVNIDPLIDEVRPGWSVTGSNIANLSSGESQLREVFVKPPANAEPGRYVSPVVGRVDEERVDVDYFTVRVKQTEFRSALRIQEAPRRITLERKSSRKLPVLVENSGKEPLGNITGEIQNLGDCGDASVTNINGLRVNESASLGIEVNATGNTQNCNATLILSTSTGDYAFNNVQFSITPEDRIIPQKKDVPIISIVWTALLALYAVLKKRYNLESLAMKIPLVLLMMGEAVIILYLLVNYYGIIQVAFLPF